MRLQQKAGLAQQLCAQIRLKLKNVGAPESSAWRLPRARGKVTIVTRRRSIIMSTITIGTVRRCGSLIVALGALGSFMAIAAETPPQEHIVVEAARSTAKVIGRADVPGRLVRVELRGQVSYSDLDLTIGSNAKVLKQRVRDAAHTICSDLDKVYQLHESVADCASRAERDAMAQVEGAIAGAQDKVSATK
jgi:UrcA family protein